MTERTPPRQPACALWGVILQPPSAARSPISSAATVTLLMRRAAAGALMRSALLYPFCLQLISMLSATLSRLYLVGRRDGSKVLW